MRQDWQPYIENIQYKRIRDKAMMRRVERF